ncbi:MAG: PorT family protein [Prevotellaceae bacterium]|jgi:hypothetical protein|nr:PorT family protein [Prevotellaceae bacterium]
MFKYFILKKTLLSIALLWVFILPAATQTAKVQNLPMVDYKRFHFGFTLGLHSQDFMLTPSEIPDNNGIVWRGDVAQPSPGFTVGIISDFRMGEYFNLRFVPTLNFGERQVSYSGFIDEVKVDEFSTSVLSTLVSMPFYVKYRSKRLNNYRPYLIAGGGAMIDLSRKKDMTLLLKPFDLYVEFGVGCDFYLPYFKLAPELRMCLGFNDMIERDRPAILNEDELKYTQAVKRLTSRLLVLTFNFE